MISTLPSLPASLRAATAPSHRRLEEKIAWARACGDVWVYRWLIGRFLGFYEPLESRIAAANPPVPDLEARWKSGWLEADFLAIDGDAETVAALERCLALPQVESPAQAIGCAYVLEGATLGGSVMFRLLEGSPVPPGARRFFAGYGELTAARWKEFQLALEVFAGEDVVRRRDVVCSAVATFDALEKWIEA